MSAFWKLGSWRPQHVVLRSIQFYFVQKCFLSYCIYLQKKLGTINLIVQWFSSPVNYTLFLSFSLLLVLCDGIFLENGQVRYNQLAVNGQYPVDTVASITCDYGYNLEGANSRVCQSSGTWSQKSTLCKMGKKSLLITAKYWKYKLFNTVFTYIKFYPKLCFHCSIMWWHIPER